MIVRYAPLSRAQARYDSRLNAELVSMEGRKFRSNIPITSGVSLPTFVKSLASTRSFCAKLIVAYANELAKVSPSHGEAEAGNHALMIPQVALTSCWAHRQDSASDWTPDPVVLEFLAYELNHALRSLIIPPPLGLARSFRVDRAHKGPTNSTGWDSLYFTWWLARKLGFSAYPNFANYRHGTKGSDFYNISSLSTGFQRICRQMPLVRLVIMIPLINSLLMRPYADALTILKAALGSGKLMLDIFYVLYGLTRDEYVKAAVNDGYEIPGLANVSVDEIVWVLSAVANDIILHSGDYRKFDQHCGLNSIRAVTRTADSVIAPHLAANEDYGLGPIRTDPVEWQSLIRAQPYMAPAGEGDAFSATLTPTPNMLLSGQPDTAGTGSLLNWCLQHEAAAEAYGITLRELFDHLKTCDERGLIRPFRVCVFSDDTLISAKKEIAGWIWNDAAYWDAFAKRGFKFSAEPLSFLRHHIIPGVGVLPQWTRRFARSVDPEYGYHDDDNIAKLSALGKFQGMAPDGSFRGVRTSNECHEKAAAMRKLIWNAYGMGSLRPTDAAVFEAALAQEIARTSKQSLVQMNPFELEQFAERLPSTRAQIESITQSRMVSLISWATDDKMRKLAEEKTSSYSVALMPQMVLDDRELRECHPKHEPNAKL